MKRLGIRTARAAEVRRILALRHRIGSESDLDELLAELPIDIFRANRYELGRFLKLTLKEHFALGIRSIRPYDVTDEQYRAFYDGVQKRRDREYRRRKRRAEKVQRDQEKARRSHAVDLSVREEALWAILSYEWRTVDDLARGLASMPVWRRPDGRNLPPTSLKAIIRREIHKLGERVEVSKTIGTRGEIIQVRRSGPADLSRTVEQQNKNLSLHGGIAGNAGTSRGQNSVAS